MNDIVFILIAPQMGENIGAAARVMSNFGLRALRIVNPRDGWPNDRAISMAAHGAYVLDNAEVFSDLETAIHDIQILYATTSAARRMDKPIFTPKQYPEIIGTHKVGIMFGCERSGLTNEHIMHANAILTINTNPANPSMNIAQAIAVIAYELSMIPQCNALDQDLASKQELGLFTNILCNKLENSTFFRVKEKKTSIKNKIINAINSKTITKQELKLLYGILNALTRD